MAHGRDYQETVDHIKTSPTPLASLQELAAPGAVERSEAAGTRSLAEAADMPVERRDGDAPYLALGFVFGAQVDTLFQKCTLPPGWRMVTSDHAMWNYVLDERGRRRVAVFYKAAYYDRRASARMELAVLCDQRYPKEGDGCDGRREYVVTCAGVEVHNLGWGPARPPREKGEGAKDAYFAAHDRLDEAQRAWADKHYPNRTDPTAYWD